MSKNSYYITKGKKKKEIVSFELEKLEGYQVNPKTKKDDSIEVSKIIFVNKEFSEKIIRKKIDKKISALLEELKIIDEDDSGDNEGTIRRSLMDAEKLRLQIINTYVKYLGHTYEGLTLKKLQIIIEQLRYKLYYIEVMKREVYFDKVNQEEERKESRRGRQAFLFIRKVLLIYIKIYKNILKSIRSSDTIQLSRLLYLLGGSK